MNNDKIMTAYACLEELGFLVSDASKRRVDSHLELISTLGRAFGVVSFGDIERGSFDHVVDSLSLIPILVGSGDDGRPIVDIGSGGGFPGLVVASMLPEVEVKLIERTQKKSAFLRRCVAELGLFNVEVLDIRFQDYDWGLGPVRATVRGLERSIEMVPELVSDMVAGSVCYWLTGSDSVLELDSKFHVEQIVDNWSERRLRRGILYSITM